MHHVSSLFLTTVGMQSGSFQTFLDFEKISSNQRFWNFYFIVFFFKNNQLKALFGEKMKNWNF